MLPGSFTQLPKETRERVIALAQANRALPYAERFSSPNGFNFEGVWVTDPFMDETGTRTVDPVQYYGDCFLLSVFCEAE
jgi:hypothetical protein